MDIKDMDIFCTIAREKSVTKASKILYMTPQGLSKVIKNLETELNCKLFFRESAGMLLTESGRRFLDYAQHDIEEYHQMRNDVLHIEQTQNMQVDLLSAYGILRMVTPDCISRFRGQFSGFIQEWIWRIEIGEIER